MAIWVTDLAPRARMDYLAAYFREGEQAKKIYIYIGYTSRGKGNVYIHICVWRQLATKMASWGNRLRGIAFGETPSGKRKRKRERRKGKPKTEMKTQDKKTSAKIESPIAHFLRVTRLKRTIRLIN